MSKTSWCRGYLVVLQLVLTSSIPQIDIHFTMTEEVLAPGSLLSNLAEEEAIRSNLEPDAIKQIHFQYLSTPPIGLSVEPSGLVRITEWVDRENICPNKEVCQVKVDLAIQPAQYFALVKVTITVDDINDNKPLFVEAEITHVVSEITRVGTTFALPELSDPDSPAFSVQKIFLRPASEHFELRTNSKPDGSQEVRLVLNSALDRETLPEHHLQAIAVDGGDPGQSGTLDITIIVADANDNHPTFDQQRYEVSVKENAPLGYVLLVVHASDLDKGLNGHIVYSLSPESMANVQHMFSINNDTGEIMVNGKVDHEEGAIWYLTVEARDQGADPIPTETLVIIHVDDVNDNAPQITIHTLNDAGHNNEAIVMENTVSGTFVARVVVSDKDSGPNGRYNCSLYEQHFVLDPFGSDFLITTRGLLDREVRSKYSLIIKCHDHGSQPLTTTAFVQVSIADINDNSPRFSQQSYLAHVTENNYPKTVVMHVTATDPDYGDNGSVQYMIADGQSQWFSIDPITGEVTTRVSLDREAQQTHHILIVARDKGMPSLSTSTTLTVLVLDTNDEGPEFTQNKYIFRMYENQAAGSEVGIVRAVDLDSEQYSQHTYHLQVDPFSAFHIDAHSGRISIIQVLDREEQNLHTMVAVAVDTSDPHFSSSATVSVYVLDRNDNPPRFTFPTLHNNTVFIGNDLSPGHRVTRVQADDADGDDNGQVRYELVQSTDEPKYFVIEPYTGVITLVSSIRHIDNGSFQLTLIATDDGHIPMSTSAKLYIVVDRSLSVPLAIDTSHILSNVIIVIVVSCVCSVIILGLVVAIFIICKRNHRKRERPRHKYDKAALTALAPKDDDAQYSRKLSPLEKKRNNEDQVIEKDIIGMCKFPEKSHCQSNRRASTEIDLSVEKSRQWLEQIKTDKSPYKKEADAISIISGLESNTDSGHGLSVQCDLSSRSTIEYGFTPGYHKDLITSPHSSVLRRSLHDNQNILWEKSNTSLYAGSILPAAKETAEQRRAKNTVSFTSSTRTEGQPPHYLTKQSAKSNAVSNAVFGTARRGHKHCEPIMFARCHDNRTRTAESDPVHDSPPFTNAHGYHGNTPHAVDKSRDGQHSAPLGESTSSDNKQKNETLSSDCQSSAPSCYRVDCPTVTHIVNGVKITDIIV